MSYDLTKIGEKSKSDNFDANRPILRYLVQEDQLFHELDYFSDVLPELLKIAA